MPVSTEALGGGGVPADGFPESALVEQGDRWERLPREGAGRDQPGVRRT